MPVWNFWMLQLNRQKFQSGKSHLKKYFLTEKLLATFWNYRLVEKHTERKDWKPLVFITKKSGEAKNLGGWENIAEPVLFEVLTMTGNKQQKYVIIQMYTVRYRKPGAMHCIVPGNGVICYGFRKELCTSEWRLLLWKNLWIFINRYLQILQRTYLWS